ncbi:LysR family transcriptional regulator [Sphingobium xenophagum]|uniref:LysR family transcriptional regulator n=1 Tax=Sphingobium xenophagum TaxID=121428 RepID=UPI00241D2FD5|nr:LysR family transcriptional regulator [Sphingobium xenophagum]
MPFDLNQLRYALCVSQHGSFHLAANVLGTSQGLLEGEVSALEARIGLTLFEPVGNELRSTQRGAHFLHDAEHLLWRAEQVALRLSGARSVVRQSVYPFHAPDDSGPACACAPPMAAAEPMIHPVRTEIQSVAPSADDRTCRYADLCRALLAAHKRAGRAFGNDLISDPASEMLLDLYVREHEGQTTSITSFWGAASSALGTARRSLTMMERRGFIVRTGDPSDGRRALVKLTPSAREQLEECFEVILCSAALSVDEVATGVPRRLAG